MLASCRTEKKNTAPKINSATDPTSITTETSSSLTDTSSTQSKKHTVTFKDYDGRILKTESVEEGKAVLPPDNASKEGYKIVDWDKPIDNIKEDMVVTPVYEKISGPTISVGNTIAKAGDTVKIPVRIYNNPGINGASISISFDSKLTLKKVKNGDALDDLNFTKPGELTNPCTILWDGIDESIKEDGEMLVLSFKISDDVQSGQKLGITVSYKNGEIYDKDLNDVDFDVVGGSITIE